MDVVRNPSCAIAFTVSIPGHRGKIRVKLRPHRRIKNWGTFFRTEDDVDEEIGEGLRHGEEDKWLLVGARFIGGEADRPAFQASDFY